MDKELRILVAEDVPADAELEIRELKRAGLRVAHRIVETEEAFREALREFLPEIILSDFSMPQFDGMFALALARELAPDVPFIFVSGTIGEEYAIRALKNGATDYVLKNNLVRLPAVVERALQDAEARVARKRAEQDQRRLAAIVENSYDAIISRDLDRKIMSWNTAAERMFGYTAAEVIGRDASIIIPPESEVEAAQKRALLQQGRPIPLFDSVRLTKDGRRIDVSVGQSPINDASGKMIGASLVFHDISERKSHELKIARLSRIHAVLSGINSAIVRIRDRQQLFEEACRIAVEHGNFGLAWIGLYDPATLDVTPVAWAGLGSDEMKRTKATARADVPQGQGVLGRAILERKPMFDNNISVEASVGGRRRQEALRLGYRSLIVLPLFAEGAVAGILALFAKEPNFFDEEEIKLLTELAGDISFSLEHIGKEEKLNYLAYYDVLTGLPNRALFNDRLEQRVTTAHRDQRKFSVMMVDIERFRHINETLGRQAGDDLLRQVAERLKGVLGETDVLAHVSGDYFAIATRCAEAGEDVAHVLNRILTGISGEPFRVGSDELRIAPRAGIALYPADGADADALLKNAEAALKNAKTTGNQYQFYASQMNARVAEQLRLENDLRRAVLEEQFVLHYQPRLDLLTGHIIGLEALIRWNHPQRGLVAPGEFIPILENTGLILEVGRWALKRAAHDHAVWRAAGVKPPRIAVNVSAFQLRRNEFVEDVRTALSESGDSGEQVDIEITESMLMEDIGGNIEKLKALQATGLQVALDDFGTGYSSLSYLARLPINSLKIDRSFITQMPKSPEQMAIVSTVISLARALNLKVVAEGVETEEQANLLRLLRCDEVQGYLFGRPQPPEQIEALLAKQ